MSKNRKSVLPKTEIKATLLGSAHKILARRHVDLARLDKGGYLRPHEKEELADIASFLGRYESFLGKPKYAKREPKPSVPREATSTPRTLARYDIVFMDGEVRQWFCAAHGEPSSENLRMYISALHDIEKPRGHVRIMDPKTGLTVCQVLSGRRPADPPSPPPQDLIEGAYVPLGGRRQMKTGRTG